jgi:energy-coupling factor transport system permease protein
MKDFFYRYKDTRFHNLHPALKSLFFLVVLVAALLVSELVFLLALLVLTFLIALEARILDGWFTYLKMSWYMALIIILLNLLLNPSPGTYDSLLFASAMALRLAVTISAFAIFSLTVSPQELMKIMSMLRIPSSIILMISLSLRFVPVLFSDVGILTQVQKSRGAKLKGIRGKKPLIIPLISNSLERSLDVAEALEARGFNNDRNRQS